MGVDTCFCVFWLKGVRFKFHISGSRAQGSEFKIVDSGLRVQGLGFRFRG
jgi:hypothetical protein